MKAVEAAAVAQFNLSEEQRKRRRHIRTDSPASLTAGDELERAVSQLGFKGAMINGHSNIGDMDTAQYLDEPPVWDFWARVEALDVPVYLHRVFG